MFEIQFGPMEWLNGPEDDPRDLCSHGEVSVCLGDKRLTYACCTSAAAIRMLRSLTEDHEMEDHWRGEQMLPCCGHAMYPSDDGQSVYVSGCPNGIDYAVGHAADAVVITTEDGSVYDVPFGDYFRETMRFIDAVEAFYKKSTPKILPEDAFSRDGYLAFWKEWDRRKDNLKKFYFPENNA